MSFVTRNQFRTGGKSEGDRHFRVVSLENKNVSLGGVSISSVASPSDAARKLLKSIAHEKGFYLYLTKMLFLEQKLQLEVILVILI